MVRNPDEPHLLAYLEKKYPHAQEIASIRTEHEIVRSRPLRDHYFGEDMNLLDLEVVLGDWGVASWTDKHLMETIQPLRLRAPKVILEVPWNQAVDIWDLGALIPELIYGKLMFSGGPPSLYTTKVHLEEMSTLLGAFPVEILSQTQVQGLRKLFDAQGDIRKLIVMVWFHGIFIAIYKRVSLSAYPPYLL